MNRIIAVSLAVLCGSASAGEGELVLRSPTPGGGDGGWNQWRGPNRDGLSPDKGIVKKWPRGGPPLVWKATGFGDGFSNFSFWGDLIFTMGDVGGECKIIAAQVKTGKIVWTAKVGPAGAKRNPGPRSTPATDGKLVFALGQKGDLVCVTIKGKEVWRKNLVKGFGGKMPGWEYASSPVLDGDQVVCIPGGSRGAVMAFKKATGTVLWQSGEITDKAEHTSLLPVEIGGVRQYILFTKQSVAGIEAAGGKVLWRAGRKGKTAICTDALYKDGIVFVSSGYGLGCHAFKITARGKKFSAQQIYSGTQMLSHHGGMVLLGNYIYGLDDKKGLKCLDIRTGKVLWENRSVGKGSIAYADGLLVVRSEKGGGAIGLVQASPRGYRELGRFDQPERTKQPSWTHPLVFGGRLYIRDQDLLLCYKVGAR